MAKVGVSVISCNASLSLERVSCLLTEVHRKIAPRLLHPACHVRSIWDLRTRHVRVSGLTKLFIEQLSSEHDKNDDAIVEAVKEAKRNTRRSSSLVGITKRSGSELCQGCWLGLWVKMRPKERRNSAMWILASSTYVELSYKNPNLYLHSHRQFR